MTTSQEYHSALRKLVSQPFDSQRMKAFAQKYLDFFAPVQRKVMERLLSKDDDDPVLRMTYEKIREALRDRRIEFYDREAWVISTAGYKSHSPLLGEIFEDAQIEAHTNLASLYTMRHGNRTVCFSESVARFDVETSVRGRSAIPSKRGNYRRVIIDVASKDKEAAKSEVGELSERLKLIEFNQRKLVNEEVMIDRMHFAIDFLYEEI